MSKRENTPAKMAVIGEWDNWAVKNPKDAKVMNGMFFFTYLQKEKPELLRFRSVGDRWQTVHGWLLREGRVND
jgi:hypothetical protein